ncbi:MAG: hypothetical protein K5894_04775 [Lachnospiraceae bacterium]|nr:hypothetical protein [Lachnospiraceae bacterium]MDN4743024.1 hypothetical protein [Lachnospiraceae bacterium C1.1]
MSKEDEQLITSQALYGYSHYIYGEAYFGSCRGMRYRLAREPLEDVRFAPEEKQQEGQFMVTVWPEPLSYEKAPEDIKKNFYFPFTEQGRLDAIACLNEQYQSAKDDWDKVRSV